VRARNLALGTFLLWGFIAHGKLTIDALLWADNVDLPESRKQWCDFASRVMDIVGFGLTSSGLCVGINLKALLRATAGEDPSNRRQLWHVVRDVVMCIIAPIVFLACYYANQQYRFTVIEDFGCRSSQHISIVSVLLIDLPLFLVATCILVVSIQNVRYIKSCHSVVNGRYYRVLALVFTMGIWGVIFIGAQLIIDLKRMEPYGSWNSVHALNGTIQVITAADMSKMELLALYVVFGAFVIPSFLAFGFLMGLEVWRGVWKGVSSIKIKRSGESESMFMERLKARATTNGALTTNIAFDETGSGNERKYDGHV